MHKPSKARSPQARVLRGIILRKTILQLVLYTFIFVVCAAWTNAFIVPDLANWIADNTSYWMYFSPEEYDHYLDSVTPEQLAVMDIYSLTGQDGSVQYAVRDLGTYYLLRTFKLPCALILYFAGIAAIAFSTINRALEYFDLLASSIEGLFASRSAAVTLPDDLSIVRSELDTIRAQTKAAEDHARQEEQRKNELVAYLAHDIKTPLTSILGYLSLLKEVDQLPAEQRRHYASIASGKAEHLEAMIDEFFEITRYNLHSIPLERETLDVGLFCQQIADEFFPEAQRKELSIAVSTPERTSLFADPSKLARAVSNVMRNALAYADRGTAIDFQAKVIGDIAAGPAGTENACGTTAPGSLPAAAPGVLFTIRNQGKEISPAHLQSIFEKFFREDNARTTNQGGAGLGLAIAKEIMAAHGGTITATSDQGITTFKLFVPSLMRT